jgi:hypothetical protein
MVKYLNFHNSLFALGYFFICKWQGHNVTHPLFTLTHSQLFVNSIILKWPPRGQKGAEFDYFHLGIRMWSVSFASLHTEHTLHKILMWDKRKESSSSWYKKEFQNCVCPWPPPPGPPSHPRQIPESLNLSTFQLLFEHIPCTRWLSRFERGMATGVLNSERALDGIISLFLYIAQNHFRVSELVLVSYSSTLPWLDKWVICWFHLWVFLIHLVMWN